MVAILVALTFIVFVLVDSFLTRREERLVVVKAKEEFKPIPLGVNYVAGLKLPDSLRYHPGHTWALDEGRNVVRAGIDEFAANLLGKITRVELPKPGQWLRQGERGWTLSRNSEQADMLSPIEGEVIAVNEEVLKQPSLARSDPYGAGWLIAVSSFASESNFKNLLHGRMAHRWMEESVEVLRARASGGEVTTLQDGGQPSDDIISVLGEESWREMVREFFLT